MLCQRRIVEKEKDAVLKSVTKQLYGILLVIQIIDLIQKRETKVWAYFFKKNE